MSLADILEKQIEPEHLVHEFIRIYKEMYPAESGQPSTTTSTPPTPILEPTLGPILGSNPGLAMGPLAEGRPMLFACANGYFDLVECRFIPTKTADAGKLNSRVSFPDTRYYDGPSMEAKYLQEIDLQKFLDQIFPDPQMQNYVLNLYAEKLDGVHRRNEFVVHLGSGANGRSAFQLLLQETFGDYYQTTSVVKPNTRIARFDYSWLIRQPGFIKASSDGEKYGGGPGCACVYDFRMCMVNTEVNEMPNIGDAELKRRFRVIHYPTKFVDSSLTDPITHLNQLPQDHCIYWKVTGWAPFFLEMLFERYKTLKTTGFRQLGLEEIPASVHLV